MDIERINSVLNQAVVALQDDEIEFMSEAVAGGYRVPTPGAVMGTDTPKSLSWWSGQDWYYMLRLSDDTLYFRPTKVLKNGNMRGLMVTVEYGRRGARKAVQQSVNKMDFGGWKPIPRKELSKVVLNRFRDRL